MNVESRTPTVAVGVVVRRGSEILLVRRGKQPHQGYWSIPGGHLEYGETISNAARREVREECGIEIELRNVKLVLTRIGMDEDSVNYHYVIIDLLADWVSGDPMAGDDAEALEWVRYDDIGRRATTPGLADYVGRILRSPGAALVSDVVDAGK